MDRLFRENHDILIYKYKDAIAPHRPAAYFEREAENVRRASSVSPQLLRRAVGKVRTNEEDPAAKEEERKSSEESSPA